MYVSTEVKGHGAHFFSFLIFYATHGLKLMKKADLVMINCAKYILNDNLLAVWHQVSENYNQST